MILQDRRTVSVKLRIDLSPVLCEQVFLEILSDAQAFDGLAQDAADPNRALPVIQVQSDHFFHAAASTSVGRLRHIVDV